MRVKTRDIEPVHRDVIRFWARVQKSDGCWEWTGKRTTEGHGRIAAGGKIVLAHRFSYRLHYGVIPDEMVICHNCHNSHCVRPDHLRKVAFRQTAEHVEPIESKRKTSLAYDVARYNTNTKAAKMYEMVAKGETHARVGFMFGVTADQVRQVLDCERDKRHRA